MPDKPKRSPEVEARLERAQKAAEDGAEAMSEHHANARAVDAKTASLKKLRLAQSTTAQASKPKR